MISEDTKQEILSKATLEAACERYLPPYGDGKKWHYTCPLCGKRAEYSPKKNILKCFHCEDFTASGDGGAVALLMKSTKLDYPAAMEKLAADFGVVMPLTEQPAKGKAKAEPKAYYKRQLEDSGLTEDDVRVKWNYAADSRGLLIFDPKERGEVQDDAEKLAVVASPFMRGTVIKTPNKRGVLEERPTMTGDDMLIQYADLDGRPETYLERGKEKPFYRVRWEYPASHLTKDGKMCKYKSPAGSGTHIYIPEKLRQAYKRGEQIERLYFCEGEKKAEAVSKYVGPAFGMGGINSLGQRGSEGTPQIPEAVIRVIEACGVKEVCFIMDADWCELSPTLDPTKDAQKRSYNFYYAARNFKDWMRTLKECNLYVDTYLILGKNCTKAKGVDDQLMLLRPDTDRYAQAVTEGIANAIKGGETELFDVKKISEMSDGKLAELWGLNNIDSFVELHREVLSAMPSFKIGKYEYRINAEGKAESIYALVEDETFWNENIDQKTGETKYGFNYARFFKFLKNRGYHAHVKDGGDYQLIKVSNGHEMSLTDQHQIQRFALDFVETYKCPGVHNEDIINMILRGVAQYMGEYKLFKMKPYEPTYIKPDRESQTLIFNTKYWRITPDGVEEHELAEADFDYWDHDRKDYDAHRLEEPLVRVSYTRGRYSVELGADAERCQFLHFLAVTSWINWDEYLDGYRKPLRGERARSLSSIINEEPTGLLSKMTAIGYLLHQYKNPSVQKAIIAMDAKDSEMGANNGRSGKSLIAEAVGRMVQLHTIDCKKSGIEDNPFIFGGVTSQTRVILMDDLERHFRFERLFSCITGDLNVNGKNEKPFTLTGHQKPKFLLTTNHTIQGFTSSYKDRQFKIAFSDYYDDTYKPEHEYGCLFWSEDWDADQWNLFYNLMAECVGVYLLAQSQGWGVSGSGLVEGNTDQIRKREQHYVMTDTFYEWALGFYGIKRDDPYPKDISRTHLNEDIPRTAIQESYNEWLRIEYPNNAKVSSQECRKRMVAFCNYMGYVLNPTVPHSSDGTPLEDVYGEDRTGLTPKTVKTWNVSIPKK